jgi:acyl-coenzyme A thioesterase PaaI-like protein
MIIMTLSLQDQFAPNSICFGCGPSNAKGLKIKSFVQGDVITGRFTPEPYHHAFPGVLYGGTIASILDCHCNWSACWYLMQHLQTEHLPCMVTAELTVKYLKPTPMDTALELKSILSLIEKKKVIVQGELSIAGTIYNTVTGTFIQVSQNHPAFHRC